MTKQSRKGHVFTSFSTKDKDYISGVALNLMVKWSKEALDFFSSYMDNTVDLMFIVCHECASQSGEGFEEFVNSINNSEDIMKKIKKLIVLDASYLYRHCIHGFAQYSDPKIETIWMGNNRSVIGSLKCDVRLNSWLEQIKNVDFKQCYEQIMIDYAGDENGNGLVCEFRDIVVSEAKNASSKGRGTFEGCRDFILEESHMLVYI